jgi:hypothetical protein
MGWTSERLFCSARQSSPELSLIKAASSDKLFFSRWPDCSSTGGGAEREAGSYRYAVRAWWTETFCQCVG